MVFLPVQESVFMQKSVLFVCTGNTCRSPLAEAWFNKCASDQGLTGYRACSAGLYANNGSRASEHSRMVAAENGASLEDFRSRMLTYEMVEDASLIVGLTDGHCRKIAMAVPEAAEKIKRIMEFADAGGDVGDPYGGMLDDYRRAFADIKIAVENLVEQLKNNF